MKYQCPLSSFVIWAGKRARTTLLFSYPVGRRKVFPAKIAVVSLFVATAMVTSCISIFIIFGISESISTVVDGNITFEIISRAAKTTFYMSISAVRVGIIFTIIHVLISALVINIMSRKINCMEV